MIELQPVFQFEIIPWHDPDEITTYFDFPGYIEWKKYLNHVIKKYLKSI